MPSTSWSTEQLAVLILVALVASAVICIVILASRPWLYGYAVLAGILGGVILRLTPGGQLIAMRATGLFVWIGQPIIGACYALLVAAVFDLLFSPRVPVLRHVRPYGRRALRPWRWGTGVEIAERAGVASWLPEMIGVGVPPPRPLSAAQLMVRVRVIAGVLCGSCVGVFFAIPEFRSVLVETLTPAHILANLIATAFVTFLLGPLHDEIMQLTGTEHGPTHTERELHGRLLPNVGLFMVTGVLLMLLQAVHVAIHGQIETLSLYQWILLLELCVLPLLVTSYYFGAALHRSELGEQRWDRALEASVFAGTIVVAPFTINYQLTRSFPLASWDSWSAAFAGADHVERLGVLVLLTVLVSVLIGIAVAVIASAATYGVYAIALALAMSGATRADARRRACLAVLIGGVIAQGFTSLAVWWLRINEPVLHYLHLVLAAGWVGGLYASRFQEEVAPPKSAAALGAPSESR